MINKYTLDDLFVGMKYSLNKNITKNLIDGFSSLTGDEHPLHKDQNYAIKHDFDDIIAQGFLLSSFISFVVGMKMPGLNALIVSQESKFLRPVYINREIFIECEITKIDTRFSLITIVYNIKDKEGTKLVTGNVLVKVRS